MASPDDPTPTEPVEPVGSPARTALVAGAHAPTFDLEATDGRRLTLSALAGQRTVLCFYPRDGSPQCTAQACDHRDARDALHGAGVAVVGISGDSIHRHQRFVSAHGLTFPLLSDPGNAVAAAYGAFGEKSVAGRKVMGTIRSTFVIGPDLRLERVYTPVLVPGHVAALLADLVP